MYNCCLSLDDKKLAIELYKKGVKLFNNNYSPDSKLLSNLLFFYYF